jgi:tape measure domain-containing protein
VAQSTVKLIVDAQNAIRPLQRVNEQTKALSSSTDKLKGRLNRSNQSLRDTGRAAKTASAGVGTLVGALKPLLAALAVVGTARFIFFKTAELETQRASLKKLTDSAEKTNEIIQELQDFGAVTPFTSSELIEQTKRLKAFGFATEELVDTTKRLSDIAGATGADLTGIATAFGQIRAKGKLQQEENLQLLERGVDITTELKRITGLQGDEFESAMRKGKIGADLVNQALINLTSQGGIFAGGATAQADTLNGKLSTLQDTIDTLARTIGTELEDEIKGILDISIKAVKQISTLIESIGLVSKLGEKDMIKIETEARTFATEEVSKDFGFFERRFSADARKQFQEIFDLKKKELVSDALTTKELTKQKETQDKIKESVTAAKNEAAVINEQTTLLNESLGQTDTAVDTISNSSNKVSTNIKKAISETDQLKEKFMEIGQSVEQGIVSNLTDAVMGTKTLAQAAISVLDNLKRKLIEVAIQKAVAGIGGKLGGFLGGLFGKRASGGPVAAGGAYLVGERGPEILQMGSRGGNIIPNSAIGGGGTTNVVTVNVDAKGSSVAGNGSGADALGQLIGGIVQQTLVKEQRAGGLLNR